MIDTSKMTAIEMREYIRTMETRPVGLSKMRKAEMEVWILENTPKVVEEKPVIHNRKMRRMMEALARKGIPLRKSKMINNRHHINDAGFRC